uniref:Uncharacterized protein n=1 Tax=Ciona intestinalis TaxID=7719 RepID=H2XY54_CIOIN
MSMVLQQPACKLFLNQLVSAELWSDSNVSFNKWKLSFGKNSALFITNAWIQGHVVKVDNETLLINDGTGLCLVTGLSKLPLPSKPIQENDVVMVIGYISNTNQVIESSDIQNIEICARLRGIKVTDISQNKNCCLGKLWKSEVNHAQQELIQMNST